ncbi:MAG: hypothetical protein QW688_07960 [Thermoprotei archaeon]
MSHVDRKTNQTTNQSRLERDMANAVNRWLLRRVLYLLSVYFVLGPTPQSTLLTTIFYELNNVMVQFELPFGWSLFLTTAQIAIILVTSILIAVLGVYLGFKKTFNAGGTLLQRLGWKRGSA